MGVAFFLMAAVNAALAPHTGRRFKMDRVLDLVALGTLADVMRLGGQNRILVRGGLDKLAEAARPGIAALKTVSGSDAAARLNAGQVVFRLAPRINAAGRMGAADTALRLLRSKDPVEALRLARHLDALNTQRREEEERIWAAAREQARRQLEQRQRPALVLYGGDWHPGIVGIVASRIVEEFYRPTIILCDDNNMMKGSGRSIREFDLYAGLQKTAHVLAGFGGHKLAAGVRLEPNQLERFREAFEQVVADELGGQPLTPALLLECELDFQQASDSAFLQELELMQPFGAGNAEPVFASPELTVVDRSPLGYSGGLPALFRGLAHPCGLHAAPGLLPGRGFHRCGHQGLAARGRLARAHHSAEGPSSPMRKGPFSLLLPGSASTAPLFPSAAAPTGCVSRAAAALPGCRPGPASATSPPACAGAFPPPGRNSPLPCACLPAAMKSPEISFRILHRIHLRLTL